MFIEIEPSVYVERGKEGDFAWMIEQDHYQDALFLFNDNQTQFLEHQNNPGCTMGCTPGGGNAIIRPYQCKVPPRAAGVPTGPGFGTLTPDVKALIDQAFDTVLSSLVLGGYRRVIFSANGQGSFGTSIFRVGDEVKDYILKKIRGLAGMQLLYKIYNRNGN